MKALIASLGLLLLCACAPISEMDAPPQDASGGDADARLAECTQAAAAMQQRLEAIEADNLRLDDANRELTATVAELRAQVSASQADRTASAAAGTPAPAAENSAPPEPVRLVGGPAGVSAVPYDAKVKPSMEFLTRYQEALELFNTGEAERAYQQFGQLVGSSAPNRMIDNCMYWMGECAYRLHAYQDAVRLFSFVLTLAGSDKAESALMARGNSYLQAQDAANARTDFTRLLETYPRSEYTVEAQRALDTLKEKTP